MIVKSESSDMDLTIMLDPNNLGLKSEHVIIKTLRIIIFIFFIRKNI
jgi:hypothetical protein